MRPFVISHVLIFFSLTLNSQQLSLAEVSDILSKVATEDISYIADEHGGNIQVGLSIHREVITLQYCWNENENVTFSTELTDVCNAISIDLKKMASLEQIESADGILVVRVKCKSGGKDCVSQTRSDILNYYSKLLHDNPASTNHYDFVNVMYLHYPEAGELLYKGMEYLAYESANSESDKMQRASTFNFATGTNQVTIDLSPTGGVSELPVSIGEIKFNAILDSGAADVSLPESIEAALWEKGIIGKEDYLPSGFYTVADGRTIVSRRFIAPSISVGEVSVQNVNCHINESEGIVLLGRAFLDAFKSWSIDNEKNQLILNY